MNLSRKLGTEERRYGRSYRESERCFHGRLRRVFEQSTHETRNSELEASNIQQRKGFPGMFINPLYLLLTFECSVICLGWMLKATCLLVGMLCFDVC